MSNDYGMFFGGGFMWILWIILLVIVVYLLKDVLPFGGDRHRTEDDAMDILRQRFARGEIDEQEFEQRKKELQGD